jgi:hypothetical protein
MKTDDIEKDHSKCHTIVSDRSESSKIPRPRQIKETNNRINNESIPNELLKK